MSARFSVHSVRTFPERALFVVAGEIVEGNVRIGMVARLFDRDTALFEEPVHGVEFVEAQVGGPSRPALAFSYSRDEKLELWQSHAWEGREMLLGWS